MIWAAIATAIMYLSGDGDDSRAIRAYFEATHKALNKVVKDASRRKRAEDALNDFYRSFVEHRVQLASTGKCIEEADRRYRISETDYERCRGMHEPTWQQIEESLIRNRALVRSALTQEEQRRMGQVFKEGM